MSFRIKPEKVPLFALSPTYLLADVQKQKRDPAGRTVLNRRRNVAYLVVGMILAGIALVVTRHGTGGRPGARGGRSSRRSRGTCSPGA